MNYKPVELKKIAIKEKNKDKTEWKDIASSDKDEMLFELCKRFGLIPEGMIYK